MKALLIILLFILVYQNGFSQETGICGTDEVIPAGSGLTPCFDVEEVKTNNLPVYIKVNVHFFLNDDCTGSIHPNPSVTLDQRFAYSTAEELVNSTNYMMELMESETQWNQAEWNRLVTIPGPTYFRYILKGVYIHCITAAKVSTYNHTSLKINATEEMNIFLVSFPGEVIGSTYGAGAIRQEVLDNWCVGHEVGHQFGLAHSFEGIPPDSQCPDMWTQAWVWDDDCNNTTNSINGFRCWSSDTYYERNVPPKHNQSKYRYQL